MRKRYSDAKLKGSANLIVNGKKIRAHFDHFSNDKYFQGICVVNKLDGLDDASL